MRLRLELFVRDIDASIRFYTEALGYRVVRRDDGYASLRRGAAVLGLGPIEKLPESGPGPGFTQAALAAGRGAGVEIVLEVQDLEAAFATAVEAGVAIAEPPQDRPWGLRDFRVSDPDGYYVRVTTG